MSGAIVEEVRRLVEVYKGRELSITVVGHSLGASLALLAGAELSACLAADAGSTCMYRCGWSSPANHRRGVLRRPEDRQGGNHAFADRLQHEHGVNVLRMVNVGDVVTRVHGLAMPPTFAEGYEHAGGAALRLDPDAGLSCCDDLEAYLHLLECWTGSRGPAGRSEPTRAIARRGQRPSLKSTYVERARMLGFGSATANGASNMQYGYLASPT